MANVFADDWDEERSQPGFSWRRIGIARRLGGELLGASLYELPPGQRSWPYHLHYANEELLIVLGGKPTLRTPEGEREIAPGDAALFPRGHEGAHQILNRSNAPARFFMISTMIEPDVGVHLDSGKIAVFAGAAPEPGRDAPVELHFPADAAVGYYEGEPPPT